MNPERSPTGYAEVNGTRLYYEAHGTGTPLLFLHGFTLDRRMWRAQVEALRDRCLVVTYDARGFGRSALPGSERYRHCDDAAALCEYLGLGPVVAVGHSIGAHQLLEFALARPDLVRGWVGLCLAGLAGVPFPPEIVALFSALRRAAGEQGVAEAKRLWGACGWFTSARQHPNLAAELDVMLADYSGWHWTHQNPAVGLEPPAAERLAELKRPSLVVTGELDMPYLDEIATRLLSGISGARAARLTGAGHMANMENPSTFNGALLSFVDQVDRAP